MLATAKKFDTLNGAACQHKGRRGEACETLNLSKEFVGPSNVDKGNTEENVRVVRDIRNNKDYYAILGVARSCSVEEVRKAYRKLSLKVHPDKNKAPGAEDAFKLVSKAFKCLSNNQSRKTYDQTGAIEDHEFNYQYSNFTRQRAARQRKQARSSFYNSEDALDPDKIFRSFYGTHDDLFHAQNAYSARGTARQQQQQRREHPMQGGLGINLTILMQLAGVLFFVLFAFIPVRQPEYSLKKTNYFAISKVTEKHGVEYFVSRQDFEQRFPRGSSSSDNLEHHVFRDYKGMLGRLCYVELQRRQWAKDYPTPHCDKLRRLSVA
ncbi:hypothetical protein ABZP36_029251 [Zizania latifolia]